MSIPKLNAPAEIHWRRSSMDKRDPMLMISVEVPKDCRSLNAADEMNCPMPRSVEKVPVRNEKRCRYLPTYTPFCNANWHMSSLIRRNTFDFVRHTYASYDIHAFSSTDCAGFDITPFLIANRHLFTSDRQIALVSSAGIPLRQRLPHIDIVHLYKARGIENRHSAPC